MINMNFYFCKKIFEQKLITRAIKLHCQQPIVSADGQKMLDHQR